MPERKFNRREFLQRIALAGTTTVLGVTSSSETVQAAPGADPFKEVNSEINWPKAGQMTELADGFGVIELTVPVGRTRIIDGPGIDFVGVMDPETGEAYSFRALANEESTVVSAFYGGKLAVRVKVESNFTCEIINPGNVPLNGADFARFMAHRLQRVKDFHPKVNMGHVIRVWPGATAGQTAVEVIKTNLSGMNKVITEGNAEDRPGACGIIFLPSVSK